MVVVGPADPVSADNGTDVVVGFGANVGAAVTDVLDDGVTAPRSTDVQAPAASPHTTPQAPATHSRRSGPVTKRDCCPRNVTNGPPG